MASSLRPALAATLGLAPFLVLPPAQALITFSGIDVNPEGVNDAPRIPFPNSEAARARFLANLTGVGTEDFEVLPSGDLTANLVFPGSTTATLREVDGDLLRIINRPTGAGGSGIFPTSGDQYLSANAGGNNRFVVSFADPVAAFGFYGVDVGDQGASLVLDFFAAGQLVESVPVPTPVSVVNGDTSGSVLFFGVITTDPSRTFDRVEFGSSRAERFDGFGFDDFTVGSLEQVTPVPATAPGAAGLLLLTGVARLRRRYRKVLSIRA